jgi:hypothetical protein
MRVPAVVPAANAGWARRQIRPRDPGARRRLRAFFMHPVYPRIVKNWFS